MSERIVFGHNFEGLYLKAIPDRLTPALHEHLRHEGVDLERLAPGYPVEVWVRTLRHTAQSLFPDVPVEEAHRELGRFFMRGYFQTALGRALLAMLKVIGPERTFKRMTHNFRTGNNFNEVDSRVVAPGHAEMSINHVLCEDPGFVHGLLQEALTLIAGTDVKVEVTSFDGCAATYVARWQS